MKKFSSLAAAAATTVALTLGITLGTAAPAQAGVTVTINGGGHHRSRHEGRRVHRGGQYRHHRGHGERRHHSYRQGRDDQHRSRGRGHRRGNYRSRVVIQFGGHQDIYWSQSRKLHGQRNEHRSRRHRRQNRHQANDGYYSERWDRRGRRVIRYGRAH